MDDAPGPNTYRNMPRQLALPGGEVLRPFVDADLGALVDVINADLEHLRPWMPWAAEPATVESQGEFVRSSIDNWATGTDFVYGIFRGEEILGGTGLHRRRGPDSLEIGYWLRRAAEGGGIATVAARTLTAVTASFDNVRTVAICCDEANTRSAGVPQRLGFALAAVEEREPLAAAETGWHQVWTIDAATVRSGWAAGGA